MSGQLIIGVGGNQSSSSSMPKNSVTSDMVKSIVVTDSAPIKEDNVLYFEYVIHIFAFLCCDGLDPSL